MPGDLGTREQRVWSLRAWTMALVGILLSACGPSDRQVIEDLEHLIQREVFRSVAVTVVDAVPGEGDDANVYMHVRFDLFAREDVTFVTGLMAGYSFRAGEKYCDAEVVMLYQKSQSGDWQRSSYFELTRRPVPVCAD